MCTPTNFNVEFITTNTRLGFVDVKKICDMAEGGCDREGEPDNIYHTAVVAYGFVYEYTFDGGVISLEKEKYFKDFQPIWNDGEFETNITKEEFEAWIETEKLETFSQKTYHVSDKNCSHFTHAASNFLGGKEPKKHSSQREWLLRNRGAAVVLQALLEAARLAGL